MQHVGKAACILCRGSSSCPEAGTLLLQVKERLATAKFLAERELEASAICLQGVENLVEPQQRVRHLSAPSASWDTAIMD